MKTNNTQKINCDQPVVTGTCFKGAAVNHIGLFEGIGGFSLAARWMGWNTIAWCEWDEYCQKVLKKNFPEAEGNGDIDKTDFTKYANTVDIITGGFPCQPYSNAGLGKGTADERHKWPAMLRAIREIQAPFIVGENVRGLVNWNEGLVFDEIQTDLENEGYEVLPLLLPSYGKNRDHKRERIFFIAYSERQGLQRYNTKWEDIRINEGQTQPINRDENVFEWRDGFDRYSEYIRKGNGLSRRLDKLRVKALGNAVDPRMAYEIYKCLGLPAVAPLKHYR